MQDKIISTHNLEKLEPIFHNYNITFAGIFGSYAKDKARYDSDIDILIDFSKDSKTTLFDMVDLKDEMQSILRKDIDLVTVNSLNKYIKNDVLKDTIIFYGKR